MTRSSWKLAPEEPATIRCVVSKESLEMMRANRPAEIDPHIDGRRRRVPHAFAHQGLVGRGGKRKREMEWVGRGEERALVLLFCKHFSGSFPHILSPPSDCLDRFASLCHKSRGRQWCAPCATPLACYSLIALILLLQDPNPGFQGQQLPEIPPGVWRSDK